ncbi:helix-turn-helix transcriptional regulator [Dictyobacter formicarum]|nr:AAA family ATPase [Dictyobacter formicarum]
MGLPLHTPISCPILIGRHQQLEALIHLIKQACSGQGQTVLLAGEAGIGKSRLVTEVIARLPLLQQQSEYSAVTIVKGRCFEPDHAYPYAPVLDALESVFASHSPEALATCVGPACPELIQLYPAFSSLWPACTSAPALDADQEKRRLFQALTHFLMRLSAGKPLILFIEDIHWSDETSLEFLLYLAHRLTSRPFLLLLTYRNEEVRPELTRFLAQLDRSRLAIEVPLTRLSIADVGMMIREIFALPHPAHTDFLNMIFALTDGNPFFIEEVLKSLEMDGDVFYADGRWKRKPLNALHIPRSVQIAVQRRLDHVTPAARELLAVAAVIGQRFSFPLLQQLTRQDERKMLDLIKELIKAQLIVEESEDVFLFRHALTRQAMYNDLLARERKAHHLAIAQTLVAISPDVPDTLLADLAYHFYMAGEWASVLEYAPRAGMQAQQLYSLRAACEHFTHALEAAHHLAVPPPLSVYRARAQAYGMLSEFELASHDYEQALTAARALNDRTMEWHCLNSQGVLWTGHHYLRAGDFFQQALELARVMDDPSILGQSLNRLGNWHMNMEELPEALRYHQAALTIFQERNDVQRLAETWDLLGLTQLVSGHLQEGAHACEQAIVLFRQSGNQPGLISCLATRGMSGASYLLYPPLFSSAHRSELLRCGEEALMIARMIGWRIAEINALVYLGLSLGPLGEFERALELARTGLALAVEMEHHVWVAFAHLLLGALFLDCLALREAQHHLEHALTLGKEIGASLLLDVVAGFLASTYIAQQSLSQAATLLDTLCGPNLPRHTQMQRLIWCARAELALARHEPAEALAIIEDTIASTASEGHEPGISPRLWHVRAEALAALGRVEEAQAMLEAALEAAHTQCLRPLYWRISISYGTILRAQGWRKQAAQAFAEAHRTIEELAMNISDAAQREHFLRQARTQLPPLPTPSPRQLAKQTYGGLTARERQVAALIAQGTSNHDLANRLSLSERTVEKHIERILLKLNFTSRTQIAVWASEKGLLDN